MRFRGPIFLLFLACFPCLPKQATAEIPALIISRNASAEVREAALQLASLIERSGGGRPEVVRERLFGNPQGIRIRTDSKDPRFDGDPLTDECIIERAGGTLWIKGSDNPTTAHAVYRFARHFLGWHYFQPGELGLERMDTPPQPPAADGPDEVLYQSRADYLSRNLIGLGSPAGGGSWRDWHGLRERLVYNHTLQRVLPPTLYDTHPEWFAKDAQGMPMRPPYYPRVHGYNDHPDLSHPDVRDWVVERTLEALESQSAFTRGPRALPASFATYPPVRISPGLVSTSISLGDSFVFGSFPEDYPWKPEGYFRRWPDWSNHVFAYSNEVAARLTRHWETGTWNGVGKPPLQIGVLAYLNWENVPDFPPHPALVPYLTYDRTQWYDPGARTDDLSTVERWNRATESYIATWDYTFGYGFFIPRSLIGIQSEAIPALHARGVRAYFSQVASLWPFDGHTTWLTANLLWDSGLDAEVLAEQYFREYFGPAARPMRRFFDLAETAWMKVEGTGWWLRYWKDPWQVILLDKPTLRKMRLALTEARGLAIQHGRSEAGLASSRFDERVTQVDTLFAMTEALSGYQRIVWRLQKTRWETATSQQLEKGLADFVSAWQARQAVLAIRESLAGKGFPFQRATDLSWVFRYESYGPALAEFREALVSGGREDLLEASRQLLQAWSWEQGFSGLPAAADGSQILYDTRFDHLEDSRIWHRQLMDSPGMQLNQTPAGLEALNIRRGHVYQLFRAEPGGFYAASAEVETNQSPSGEVYLKVDFLNESHQLVRESPRGRIAPVQEAGTRQRIRMLAEAPPETAYGRVLIRFYEMDAGSSATLHQVRVKHFAPLPNP